MTDNPLTTDITADRIRKRDQRIAEEAWNRGLHMRDAEVAELRAENEQLTGDLGRLSDHYQKLMAECDEKDAENERLRAAFRLVEPLLRQELYSDEWEKIQALIAWSS